MSGIHFADWFQAKQDAGLVCLVPSLRASANSSEQSVLGELMRLDAMVGQGTVHAPLPGPAVFLPKSVTEIIDEARI